MRKRSISRVTMLMVGLVAVCAILLGPTFSQQQTGQEKAKTEKNSDQPGTVIQAPTDAIPGSAVKLDEPSAPLLTLIEEEEPRQSYLAVRPDEVIRYFKVLFRTIIASNAP